MNARLLGFAMAIGAAWLTRSVLADPALTHSKPGAIRPGQTTDLTVVGTDLGLIDEPASLATSFPARVELVPAAKKANAAGGEKSGPPPRSGITFRVTPDKSVSVGLAAVRVGTSKGPSDPLLILIDDLPSISDNGRNHTTEEAQTIQPPVAVDGLGDGTEADYYRLTVKAGDRLSVEVFAQRLGSAFDPVVRLLDPPGRELVLADDDSSSGADPRFQYEFTQPGSYLLEVRDVQYRTGGRYRLRVGDFPLVTAAFPLGAQAGSTAHLEFVGPAGVSVPPLDLKVPEHLAPGQIVVAARLPKGKSSGLATVAVGTASEIIESEPNDQPKLASSIDIPCAINGRLGAEADRDYFSFSAAKGDTLSFQPLTRSLGSPAYLLMRVEDSAGKTLVETKGSGGDEESLTFAAAADGSYRLVVEDLVRRGGPEFAYRVAVAKAGPGFSLALKAAKDPRDRFGVPAGGALALEIDCKRTGYDGPIRLALADVADAGAWEIFPAVLPEKAAAAKVFLVPPKDAQPADVFVPKILGIPAANSGSTGEVDLSAAVAVSTLAVVKARLPQLVYPPAWMDGSLALGLGPEAGPMFAATYDAGPVSISRGAEKATFSLAVERTDKDFKDPVVVEIAGLPTGATVETKPGKKDGKETIDVTLNGLKDVAPGRIALRVVALGAIGNRAFRAEVGEVLLEVTSAKEQEKSPENDQSKKE